MSHETEAPDTAAPTQAVLRGLVDELEEVLAGMMDGLHQHHEDPRSWPHAAAVMQSYGLRLAELGEQLGRDLAAYADAHPQVEVPRAGPSALIVGDELHTEFWNEAGDASGDAALAAYAEALDGEYGRPELNVRAVALDDSGAVMVLQYLTERGPDAVCRVYVGGWTADDADRIEQALAEQGITPGEPEFWPPLAPDRTFISVEDDLYDAYGRRRTRPSVDDILSTFRH